MITKRISAGSTTPLYDFVNMATSIAPLSAWKAFYTSSAVGSKEWEMWLERFDPVSDELFVIKMSGMVAPPIGSDIRAINMPPTSGQGLTFIPVSGRMIVMQTGKGDASGPVDRSTGSVSVPLVHIRMPSNTNSNIEDFMTVKDSMVPDGGAYNLFYYKSSTGSKTWEMYAITNTMRDGASGAPAVIVLISMGGVEVPPDGSDLVAVTMPTTVVSIGGESFVGGPKTLAEVGFKQLKGPLRVFPA
ncbi:MAG: hypothetical protein MN733_05145 [Nitrososphaera sp.]|nr:hypothetical protein [Nitrososphaera sp.]